MMKEVEQLSNQGRILRNENLPSTEEMLGSTGRPRSSHVLQVLLWAGFSGFIVGVFLNATWQVAVEPAQVISGVVDYPRQTAFYIYQVKTWTAIHQVCAFFLWCGVSEAALSIILSGLLSMLYFQGLGLCTLAFSRRRILAVAAPFFVRWVYPTAGYGDVYPIHLGGSEHTYGQMGLGVMLLALALPAVGWRRLGAFVIGISPAVHPILGAFTWLIAASVLVRDFQKFRDHLRHSALYFGIGFSICLASIAYHFWAPAAVPAMDRNTAEHFIQLFLPWELFHRTPVRFDSPGFVLNLLTLAISLSWLMYRFEEIPRCSLFLLRAFVVAGFLGITFSILTWFPNWVLLELVRWMPARITNLNILACLALLLGLLASRPGDVRAQLVSALLVIGCPLLNFAAYGAAFYLMVTVGLALLTWRWLHHAAWSGICFVAVGILALGLLIRAVSDSRIYELILIFGLLLPLLRGAHSISSSWVEKAPRWSKAPPAAALLFLTIIVGFVGLKAIIHPLRYGFAPDLKEKVNGPVYAAAAQGNGILLCHANGAHLIQLRTRRPILMHDFLNSATVIPYVPEAGPETVRVWRDLYDIDVSQPPQDIQIDSLYMETQLRQKRLWESWSTQQWIKIGKQYRATEVLVSADWKLNLPKRFVGTKLVLYRIPAR